MLHYCNYIKLYQKQQDVQIFYSPFIPFYSFLFSYIEVCIFSCILSLAFDRINCESRRFWFQLSLLLIYKQSCHLYRKQHIFRFMRVKGIDYFALSLSKISRLHLFTHVPHGVISTYQVISVFFPLAQNFFYH